MAVLLRLTSYSLAFFFSKSILVISIIVTAFLSYANVPFLAIVLCKVVFAGFVFFLFEEEKLKQKLVFYQNFGLSKTLLFLISFAYDTLVSTIIYLIFLQVGS